MNTLEISPRERPHSGSLLRYAFAIVSIALATWVRILLDPFLGDHNSLFPTLLFAVLVTAWYGGLWPALVAAILGAITGDYFLVPPRGSFELNGLEQWMELCFYLCVSLGIAVLGGVMQAAPLGSLRKLRQAREAQAQVEERLRLTLRSSGIAVWNWEIEPNVMETDENVAVLFGLPPGEFPHTLEGA
jgi:K+-sensing histidine kinase KdpD